MDRGLRRASGALSLVVAAVLAGTACGSSGVHNKGATGSLEVPATPASTTEPVGDLPGRVVQVFKAHGLQQALDGLQQAIGTPARYTEIVLYPEYAVVTARQRAHPNNLQRWLFRGGTVDDLGPEPVVGSTPLDAITFTRQDVVWEVVPNLPRDARARVGRRGVKITHMIFERDPVFSAGQLVIRVYTTWSGGAGYVQYDGRGTLMRVVV